MSRPMWRALLLGSVLMGSVAIAPANANETVISPPPASTTPEAIAQPSHLSPSPTVEYETTLQQINSIQQLRDVSPLNWSYEALRNLVENYGCIVGYPDGTYRGDRSLSRNEFAAGLNACLEQLEKRLLNARNQGQSAYQGTAPNTQAIPTEPGDHLVNVVNRAFFNESLTFFDNTDISGQLNKIFGWRTAEGSFFDNQIASDGQTLETVIYDGLRQQTAGPRIRTPDLPNPFNTSVQANPDYIRTEYPGPADNYIRQQQIPIIP